MRISNILNKYLIIRVLNILRVVLSYVVSVLCKHDLHFAYQPMFLSIESANSCNLSCPECPIGSAHMRPKLREFDIIMYKQLVSEFKLSLCTLMLYFQGEPLLAKNLCEMIRFAKQYHIYIIVSTNAQVLNDELAKELVESGLDKLIISVDGLSQSSYEQYRVGGKLQKTLDGMAHVVHWKKELNCSTPHVEMQCLRLKSNEHEWAKFSEMYKSLGADSLVFKTAQFYDFEHGNSLMPTDEKYARYAKMENGKWRLKKKLRNRCWRLWSGAVVDVHGNVRPCCFDKSGDFIFGNISNQHFSEIWHNEKSKAFRRKILANRASIEMCRNCSE